MSVKSAYRKAWSEIRARKAPSDYKAYKAAMKSFKMREEVFYGWVSGRRQNRFNYNRTARKNE